MKEEEKLLETQLLLLGKEELAIEQKLQKLRNSARRAVKDARLDDASLICDLYDDLKATLGPLQTEIMEIERLLYGLRRNKGS